MFPNEKEKSFKICAHDLTFIFLIRHIKATQLHETFHVEAGRKISFFQLLRKLILAWTIICCVMMKFVFSFYQSYNLYEFSYPRFLYSNYFLHSELKGSIFQWNLSLYISHVKRRNCRAKKMSRKSHEELRDFYYWKELRILNDAQGSIN